MASGDHALAIFLGEHPTPGGSAFSASGIQRRVLNGKNLKSGEWRRWFGACGSGTGVRAGRNLLCYNFCRPNGKKLDRK